MAINMNESAINLYLTSRIDSQHDKVKTVNDIKKFVMSV
jgi:hypothetical protein